MKMCYRKTSSFWFILLTGTGSCTVMFKREFTITMIIVMSAPFTTRWFKCIVMVTSPPVRIIQIPFITPVKGDNSWKKKCAYSSNVKRNKPKTGRETCYCKNTYKRTYVQAETKLYKYGKWPEILPINVNIVWLLKLML